MPSVGPPVGPHNAKWLHCLECRLPFKPTSNNLRKHIHKPGSIQILSDAPWYYVLYEPELLLDWIRMKWHR